MITSNKDIIKINKNIKKYGILIYKKKWIPSKNIIEKIHNLVNKYNIQDNDIFNKYCKLLDKYVKTYHNHSYIICNRKIIEYKCNKKNNKNNIYIKSLPKCLQKYYYIERPFPDFYYNNKNKIGKIVFYHYRGDDKNDNKKYIKSINFYLQNNTLKGLILDFRCHIGGNMWPTLNSLHSILQNVPLFAWSNNIDNNKYISLTNKKYKNGNFKIKNITITNYNNTINCSYPIAIIIGKYTSSSGEIVASSFVGKTNTKTFGEKTSGFLSANTDIIINENINLVLTTSLLKLTNGVYQEYIIPDKKTKSPITDATKWILEYNKIIKQKKQLNII